MDVLPQLLDESDCLVVLQLFEPILQILAGLGHVEEVAEVLGQPLN